MSEQFKNNYITTLNGAIDNDDTTITVTTGPSTMTGNFRIKIDDEIIFVGNASGTSLTNCIRGYESTTPASHSNGAEVKHILTAGGLIAAPVYHLDTYPLDATYGDDFTGSSLSGSWTRRNYTSGAETYQVGKTQSWIRIAQAGRANGDGYFRTAPSGDWTFAMAFTIRYMNANIMSNWGLTVVDSSGNGVATIIYGGGPNAVLCARMSTYSTYASLYTQVGATGAQPNVSVFWDNGVFKERKVWFSLRKSGTDYFCAYSLNGESWSDESSAQAWAGTVDRIGMMNFPLGSITSGSGIGTLIEVDWFNKIA